MWAFQRLAAANCRFDRLLRIGGAIYLAQDARSRDPVHRIAEIWGMSPKKGRHQLAHEGGDGDDHSDAAFGALQFPRFGRGWRVDAAVYRQRGGHDRDRLVDPGVLLRKRIFRSRRSSPITRRPAAIRSTTASPLMPRCAKRSSRR
jgi:hypothetical protein